VERIASQPARGDDAFDDDFAVLFDGRVAWKEITAGRSRIVVVAPGKDAVPLVNTSEETRGPLSAVGSAEAAFMIGPRGHQVIGIAVVATGRITHQVPFDKGIVTSMAASLDGKTIYCVSSGTVWAVPVDGGAPRKIRSGDNVTVEAATQSLIVLAQDPPKSRLFRIPLGGGPEQEIAGNFQLGFGVDAGGIRDGLLVAPLEAPFWYWPPGVFDLKKGTSARIPLDYIQDFHHMAWGPDGKILAVTKGWQATLWKFTPQ
jgi:hypothetical protein